MSTITPPQGTRPAKQRRRDDHSRWDATQDTRDHKATLALVAVVLLVGAVAVLWFALVSGSEPAKPSAPDGSGSLTSQELKELAEGSDRHLYQRQPQDVAPPVPDEPWSNLPDGSDRHLYQRQPGDTLVAPDGSDQHLYLLPRH